MNPKAMKILKNTLFPLDEMPGRLKPQFLSWLERHHDAAGIHLLTSLEDLVMWDERVPWTEREDRLVSWITEKLRERLEDFAEARGISVDEMWEEGQREARGPGPEWDVDFSGTTP